MTVLRDILKERMTVRVGEPVLNADAARPDTGCKGVVLGGHALTKSFLLPAGIQATGKPEPVSNNRR